MGDMGSSFSDKEEKTKVQIICVELGMVVHI
jgi:hypothetical protein